MPMVLFMKCIIILPLCIVVKISDFILLVVCCIVAHIAICLTCMSVLFHITLALTTPIALKA